jgi:hypothetical protein
MSEAKTESLSQGEGEIKSAEERIPIHVSNGVALVWSLDGEVLQLGYFVYLILLDATLLRSAHHICGNLTGTLPQAAQQNVFLGLPLELLPEEVVCLMKDGAFNVLLVVKRALFVIYPPN